MLGCRGHNVDNIMIPLYDLVAILTCSFKYMFGHLMRPTELPQCFSNRNGGALRAHHTG